MSDRIFRKIWTMAELDQLRSMAPNCSNKQLAAHFHCRVQSIKRAIGNHHIKTGRTGYFSKKHRPWNFKSKGLVVSTLGMKRTQFKKGSLPVNTLSDGAITIRKDKRGVQYKHIRTGLSLWVPYHRYVWEQVNGPIPKQMVVIFKDGDTLNCAIENLQMISKKENLLRNQNGYDKGKAAKELTDNYIAGRLSHGDKKLRRALILAMPDLIDLKRQQLKLKRTLQNERHATTR